MFVLFQPGIYSEDGVRHRRDCRGDLRGQEVEPCGSRVCLCEEIRLGEASSDLEDLPHRKHVNFLSAFKHFCDHSAFLAFYTTSSAGWGSVVAALGGGDSSFQIESFILLQFC